MAVSRNAKYLTVLSEQTLNISQQCDAATKNRNAVLEFLNWRIESRLHNSIIVLPVGNAAASRFGTTIKNYKLEQVQSTATKMVGVEGNLGKS